MFYVILYTLIAVAIYNYYFHYLGETESEFSEETIKKISGVSSKEDIIDVKIRSFKIISAITGVFWPIFIIYSFIYFISITYGKLRGNK